MRRHAKKKYNPRVLCCPFKCGLFCRSASGLTQHRNVCSLNPANRRAWTPPTRPVSPSPGCYRRHQHQSRGRLGAWVSRGNRPQKETLGSVSMYPLVLLTSLVAVTVCHPPLPSLLFYDMPMTSTYICMFWTLVFLPV